MKLISPGLELVKFFMLAVLSSILYHFNWSFLMAIDKKEYILYPQLLTLIIALIIYFTIYLFYDATLKTYALAFFIINLSSGFFILISTLKLLKSQKSLDILINVKILSVIFIAALIISFLPNFFDSDVGIFCNVVFIILRACACILFIMMTLFFTFKLKSFNEMSSFLNRET